MVQFMDVDYKCYTSLGDFLCIHSYSVLNKKERGLHGQNG